MDKLNYYIDIYMDKIDKDYSLFCGVGLFDCYFKSMERVIECIEVFKEDIEKVFGLTR